MSCPRGNSGGGTGGGYSNEELSSLNHPISRSIVSGYENQSLFDEQGIKSINYWEKAGNARIYVEGNKQKFGYIDAKTGEIKAEKAYNTPRIAERISALRTDIYKNMQSKGELKKPK